MTQHTDTLDTPGTGAEPEGALGRAFSSAVSWNVAEMLVAQLVTVGLYFFLATQIPLEIFGVFFVAAILADFVYFQGRSSSVDAIMQTRDFSQDNLSSAFWAMFGSVIAIAIGICLMSPLFAWVQGNQAFLLFMPALALTLLPLPLGVPAQAKLNHILDFKGIAARGITASLAGGIAAVLMVLFTSFPEWALVVQRAVSTVFSVLFLVWRAKWLPAFRIKASFARRFFSDVSRIFFAQGLHASIPRILVFMIGSAFGQAAAGAFEWARRLAEMIYGAVAAPMGSLWVIMFSRSDMDKAERQELFGRLTTMCAMICLPLFAGLALISNNLIELVLPDSYGGIAPLLIILSGIGLLAPLFYFRNAAFTALQKLDLLVGLAIVDVLVVITTSILTIFVFELQVEYVVLALVIQQIVTIALFLPTLLIAMETSFGSMIMAIAPAYIGTLAMAFSVLIVTGLVMDLPLLVQLIAKILTGGLVYAIFLICFHRHWLLSAAEMLLPRLNNRAIGQAV
jgi:O-antigen/teichoic acid export membrane protein